MPQRISILSESGETLLNMADLKHVSILTDSGEISLNREDHNRISILTDAGETPLDLADIGDAPLQRVALQDDPFSQIPNSLRDLLAASGTHVASIPSPDPEANQLVGLNTEHFQNSMRSEASLDPIGSLPLAANQTPQNNPTDDLPAEGSSHWSLTKELYLHYLTPGQGSRDPNNPVDLYDVNDELKNALSGQTNNWYKGKIAAIDVGVHDFNENAAADHSWYTGKSDYSGLGLLAHSSDVRVRGFVSVRIVQTQEGCQKVAEVEADWEWHDQIHGMSRAEWERRYPGQSGWLSPEVYLHMLADWYGAYYVMIRWFDHNAVYKSSVFGGHDAYNRALKGDVSKDTGGNTTADAGSDGVGAAPKMITLP